jgi:hypothetical protein
VCLCLSQRGARNWGCGTEDMMQKKREKWRRRRGGGGGAHAASKAARTKQRKPARRETRCTALAHALRSMRPGQGAGLCDLHLNGQQREARCKQPHHQACKSTRRLRRGASHSPAIANFRGRNSRPPEYIAGCKGGRRVSEERRGVGVGVSVRGRPSVSADIC